MKLNMDKIYAKFRDIRESVARLKRFQEMPPYSRSYMTSRLLGRPTK